MLRRLPLSEHRKGSDEISRKIDKINSLRAGGAMPPELSRFVEMMPPRIREKAGRVGHLDRFEGAGRKDLANGGVHPKTAQALALCGIRRGLTRSRKAGVAGTDQNRRPPKLPNYRASAERRGFEPRIRV